MEGLIIMVIVFIVSTLFGKGKEQQQKKETKQMPPFSSQPAPRKQEVQRRTEQSRPKTLEDFANEVFGQLNEKVKPVSQRVERELPKLAEMPVEAARSAVEPVTEKINNRSLKERPIVAMAKKEAEAFQVVPSSKRDLMQAIVMTEVLGPPKARRK
ncbi:hypothetical protein MKX73_12735 [Solibacillus sp. FSL W7-1436]|uniref:hypothetical protein n=1 Tax=Solibacillus sp. FSL W7-1436 TaxID=2921705 RepID=UPI0030F6FA1B